MLIPVASCLPMDAIPIATHPLQMGQSAEASSKDAKLDCVTLLLKPLDGS